ncbi:S-adenosylmethionine:tRNA ribosyltransferase-isomerase [hydrothermal vent metagenome]|uniref:S-adenosylmethionine:tRNA ribosyltransferase-isomerase n=1 Tax=hydrothermal vent metagenome TaxID=652676 RepID=A0A3B1DZK1_9ZZZZ
MENLSDYNYELPESLIAKMPLESRDASRLMVVDRGKETFFHSHINMLPSLLAKGDRLIFNDTKVVPAKLFGFRTETGGKWSGLYLGTTAEGNWRIIGQTKGKLKPEETLTITPAHQVDSTEKLLLTLLEKESEGVWIVCPDEQSKPEKLLQEFGTMPLPPYIQRNVASQNDWQRYQTVYATQAGAVAAPTAGLHFSEELIQQCTQQGIDHSTVTLHVGLGTFRPIATEQLCDHQMHSEWCELTPHTIQQIESTRTAGGRIVAVGTTSVRTMESACREKTLTPLTGETNLFIRPGFQFNAVDCLLTNFHLPKSSLLVLVSAFAGYNLIREAYAAAIKEKYRFFSYGDAMLIL